MKKIEMILVLTLIGKYSFSQLDDGRTIRIPVIFHVVYSDSVADNGTNLRSRDTTGNSSTFIPTSKLLAELKDLHDDFLLLNADTSNILSLYKSRVGNPNTEFYLADTVLQLNGEKGIIRKSGNKNHLKQLSNTSKIVNPKKYLNIYIGRLKGSEGITNIPEDSSSYDNDAVYLNYLWVGLHYRLLTHEVGHWLGLLHIYGGSGNAYGDKWSCTTGDKIDDTPAQKNSTDIPCTSCPQPYGTADDQSCDTKTPSNFNNYMDYSGCRYMFTKGQVIAMRETIISVRPFIWRNSK